jgi:hypothetical protein
MRQQGKKADPHGKLSVSVSLVAGKQFRHGKEKDRWSVPHEGWLKINVDGAYDENYGEGATCVVIWWDNGMEISGPRKGGGG